jgi:hypothetical protein
MSVIDLTNQEKLEEVYRLTVENNHLLHKIQNRDRIAMIVRIIYWLAILGALGGAYYYVRPFIDSIAASNTRASSVIEQFEQLRSQFPETKALQDFFNRNKEDSEVTSAAE